MLLHDIKLQLLLSKAVDDIYKHTREMVASDHWDRLRVVHGQTASVIGGECLLLTGQSLSICLSCGTFAGEGNIRQPCRQPKPLVAGASTLFAANAHGSIKGKVSRREFAGVPERENLKVSCRTGGGAAFLPLDCGWQRSYASLIGNIYEWILVP